MSQDTSIHDFIKQNADVTVENVAPQKDEKAE